MFLVAVTCTFGQVQQFTYYDELPELNKSLKPVYSDDMPEWGKMLYTYPINFNTIDRAFIKWEAANKDQKNPLMRWYKIWRKAITPYVNEDGVIDTPDAQLIKQSLVSFQTKSLQPMRAPAAGNTSSWSFWGPKETYWLNESGNATAPGTAPWQANVYSFDVTDKNPDLLYAGTETGFINKTTDKGKTWTISGLNYPFGGGVGAIAIHPVNLDTVLVGAGGTIHRTVNGGATWATTWSQTSIGTPNRMKFDYNNPNNAIACSWSGVWISNDAGATWKQRTFTDTWDVEYKPGQSDTIYALTKNSSNNFSFVQSVDGGNTFSTVTNFPDSLNNHSGGLLAVTPDAPNMVMAIMLANNMNRRPFLYEGTNNNGVWTWVRRFVGSDAAFTAGELTNGQGYFDLVLEISPINKNLIFAGTTSLFKSSLGFRYAPTAIGGYAGPYSVHPDIQDMKMLANGDTWVSTDGGMNLTTDNFSTHAKHFALNNMLIGSDLWGFHQGWNEDIVVGGRYHNGNTSIADFYNGKALRMGGGESATGWVIQGKSRHVVFDDLGSGWILPTTAEGKPEGRFAFSRHPNMEGYGAARSNVVAHPLYSGQLYVGSDSALWVSKDFGATFDKLYEFPGMVRYFDISSQDPNVIYVDVNQYGFYRSGDGGLTFEKRITMLSSWTGGNTRFVISPYDANVVYATRINNLRSEVYKTTDGGLRWYPWSSFGSSVYIKTLAIQPTIDGKDLVYAFIDTYGFNSGNVQYRKDGDAAWTEFGTGYPSGLRINHALPFYRDSKIRVGGNGGVWESPLAEPEFTAVVVPWVEKQVYNSPYDTIQMDDHSYLNHKGAVWTWSFSPEAKYVSDIHARNPKVIFDKEGKYTVTLSITQNGVTTTRTVTDMIEVRPAPSLTDCNNPAELPRGLMKVVSVDSYQAGDEGYKAIDNDPSTIWHTAWTPTNAPLPHNIQIDLGDDYRVSKMTYVPRADGSNGRIKDYELYISNDRTNWGTYVKKGAFTNTSAATTIEFTAKAGRYAKLVALSEVNGNAWTSAAEIYFTGCKVNTSVNKYFSDVEVHAFPIPTNNVITVTLPFQNGLNSYTYNVFSSNGQLLDSGKADENQKTITVNVNNYSPGYYIVHLQDKAGINYRVKFIKK